MPIVTDKKKFSFEFPYEWEGDDGQKIVFPCKYLYGTYGPTIQIIFGQNDDGSANGVELPADIFGEIGNFLIQQGVFAPPMPTLPAIPQRQGSAVGGKPLAVPLLRGAGITLPQTQMPMTPQSTIINPLAPKAAEVSVLSDPHPQHEVPSLSSEEIIAARLAAKAKANSDGRLRKNHKEGEYVPPPNTVLKQRVAAAAEGTDE